MHKKIFQVTHVIFLSIKKTEAKLDKIIPYYIGGIFIWQMSCLPLRTVQLGSTVITKG